MQLTLPTFIAIIAACSIVVTTVIIFGLYDLINDSSWQHAELFVTSIVVNVVMMALILKQMYEYHTDSRIRIRPWIGRSGDKNITPQDNRSTLSPEMLEMKIRNHGSIPAMSIEMFTLTITKGRQLKFTIDREHNALALAPGEEFSLFMDICDIEKVDSIIFDNKKVEKGINRLKVKQNILSHFEKCKSKDGDTNHIDRPWFGCMIQYTDPTRKIRGAYLVLGDYDRKTKNIAAEILLTM